MCKDEAESYQVSEEELKAQLVSWKNSFSGILNDRYIALIEELSQLSLKHIKCQYGEWDALVSLEEQDELIEKYIRFDKMKVRCLCCGYRTLDERGCFDICPLISCWAMINGINVWIVHKMHKSAYIHFSMQ